MQQLELEINDNNEMCFVFEITDGDSMSDSMTARSFEELKAKAMESVQAWITSEVENMGDEADTAWLTRLARVGNMLQRSNSVRTFNGQLYSAMGQTIKPFEVSMYVEIEDEDGDTYRMI